MEASQFCGGMRCKVLIMIGIHLSVGGQSRMGCISNKLFEVASVLLESSHFFCRLTHKQLVFKVTIFVRDAHERRKC